MKGVVLLAVIHILIIYQSRKHKPAIQKEIPAETVIVPQVKKPAETNLVRSRPSFAVFTLSRTTNPWFRALHN